MGIKFIIKKQTTILMPFIKFFDVVGYILAGLLSFLLKFGNVNISINYQVAFILAALLVIPIFSLCGVYKNFYKSGFLKQLRLTYIAMTILMLSLASIAFITKTGEDFSRIWFIQWQMYAVIFLFFNRFVIRKILRKRRSFGYRKQKVLVIGSGKLADSIINRVKEDIGSNFQISALLNDKEYYELIGDNSDFEVYLKNKGIDEVWIALETCDKEQIQQISNSVQHCIVGLRYFPNVFGINLLGHSVSEIMNFPVINFIATPIAGFNRFIKNIEDRLLSVLILFLCSPLFLVIPLLIKLTSKGPVFYKQKRMSWNGEDFEILKFRSMPENTELYTGAIRATANDNRPTKIGAFLRKTSLDELPQFINVLKGEMSIVGPRPERPVFVEELKHEIPNYMYKHFVKGGITGWAQVNGWRGYTDLTKRLEHDLHYINNWSLLFDIKIIILTVAKIFGDENAY